MARWRGSQVDISAEKRAIRLRIARTRRRIDRRLRGIEREGRRLVSLWTLLRWPPAQSLLASLGAGLAATGRPRPGRWIRVIARHMARRAKDPALAAVLRQLADYWRHSASKQAEPGPPTSEGDEHG